MKQIHFILMLAVTLLFCSCEVKQKESARSKAIAEKYVAFGYDISGLNVQFNDSTSGIGGGVTSRMWNYGDSTCSPDGRTDRTKHTHTYAAIGAYDVTLTIQWIANICGEPEYLKKSCTKQVLVGSSEIQGFTIQNLGSEEGYVRFEMLGYVRSGKEDSVAFNISTDYSALPLTADMLPYTTILSSPRVIQDLNPYTRFSFGVYCAKDINEDGVPLIEEVVAPLEILSIEEGLTITNNTSGASASIILSHE